MSCATPRGPVPLHVAIAAIAASASLTAAPAAYEDIAERVGISAPVTFGGRNASDYISETTGTGAAIFDFDRDGDNDVLVVNGTTFELEALGRSPASMLYVNDGRGHFQEAAVRLGLTAKGWGQGVWVGDFDNDGWADLLLTRYGRMCSTGIGGAPSRTPAWVSAKSVTCRAGAPAARSWTMTRTGCWTFSWQTTSTSIQHTRRRPGPAVRASGRACR